MISVMIKPPAGTDDNGTADAELINKLIRPSDMVLSYVVWMDAILYGYFSNHFNNVCRDTFIIWYPTGLANIKSHLFNQIFHLPFLHEEHLILR
jgi:hypothetical protein